MKNNRKNIIEKTEIDIYLDKIKEIHRKTKNAIFFPSKKSHRIQLFLTLIIYISIMVACGILQFINFDNKYMKLFLLLLIIIINVCFIKISNYITDNIIKDILKLEKKKKYSGSDLFFYLLYNNLREIKIFF